MEDRLHFFASCCQICRKENSTVSCEICQMISYCTEEHRREGWFSHSTICRAIYKICMQKRIKHLYDGAEGSTPGDFRKLRHEFAAELSLFLQRPLTSFELEMLYWPKVCGQCFRFSRDLICCKGCAFEYACTMCQFKKSHITWCSTIKLFREIAIFLEQSEIPSMPLLKIPSNVSSTNDILDLASPSTEIIRALWSEMLTYPLTVYNSLLSATFSKNVILHIVGAELNAEVLPWSKWEHYLLHLLPPSHEVTLIFIGPDLHASNSVPSKGEINVCQTCVNEGKILRYELVCNTLYHNYINNFWNGSISNVTMITALNAGLYRTFGYGNSDSWKLTLEKFFAPGAPPVVVTEYTSHEIEQDHKLIMSRFPKVTVENSKLNPFASYKPSLNVISDDEIPVIFKNYYYLLINSRSIL